MRIQSSGNRTMRPGQQLMLAMLLILAAGGAASAQSNDRDTPTPLGTNSIKGTGVGKKIEYYYSFSAGPGEVVLTIDLKAKAGATGADVEVFDAGWNKIFYFFANATSTNKRVVKQFTVANKETVVLRLAFDINAGDYAIKLGGAVELATPGSDDQRRGLPDLVIDHFELTDPSKGDVKIQVTNKGGGNAGTSTLRLIVWKPGKREQKEAATVFAKVPALASGQTTSIVVRAGVPIRKKKHSLSIDVSEDVK